MAQLTEDEWPGDREDTTQEQQVPATPAEEAAPVIGERAASPAEIERRSITREPKRRGNESGRGRSGPGLDDDSRSRTREGASSDTSDDA